MKKSKLKFSNEVHATITRIYDDSSKVYHLLRNNTKIVFGKGKELLGTVFMSNPGSFEFKYDASWEIFKNGGGVSDVFKSTLGTPDPTMINIIKAIEKAYDEKGKSVPDGYVRIYNLSSVRCPKGEEALVVHNRVNEILNKDGKEISVLKDQIVYDKDRFKDICSQSPFIIMGFMQNFLTEEAERLLKWIDNSSKNKKVIAHSNTRKYPYHPIVWIKINKGKPFEDVVKGLKNII